MKISSVFLLLLFGLSVSNAQCPNLFTERYAPPSCNPLSEFAAVLPQINEECATNDNLNWRNGIPNGIDSGGPPVYNNFIICKEGFSSCGYVPLGSGTGSAIGNSGVTIGSGIDLGAQTAASLAALTNMASVITSLTPFLGLQQKVAITRICANPTTIPTAEALAMSQAKMNIFATNTETKYNNTRSANSLDWNQLPLGVRTATVSVLFRFGLNGAPTFFGHVASNDFEQAVVELRNFYTNNPTKSQNDQRLHQEANIMEASLGCSSSVDCAFLLDESGSIRLTNFIKIQDFTKLFVTEFDSSGLNQQQDAVGTRFALSTFSSTYTQEFCFNSHKSLNAYISAINQVTYSGGGTLLGLALQDIQSVFTEGCGMRPTSLSIPRVLIVLTDGIASDAQAIPAAVAALIPKNINIIVIGVGNADIQQLQLLTNQIFFLDNFNQLQELISSIVTQSCYVPAQLDFATVYDSLSVPKDSTDYYSLAPQNAGENIVLSIDNEGGCVFVYVSYCTEYPSFFVHDVSFTACAVPQKEIVLDPNPKQCTLPNVRRMQAGGSALIYIGVEGKAENSTYTFGIGTCDPQNCAVGTNEPPPTASPTRVPTTSPTPLPTDSPSPSPTSSPTNSPTPSPTDSPTLSPTASPTNSPTSSPTPSPTSSPTPSPTPLPTNSPTLSPTNSPTPSPTNSPTNSPTPLPTSSPTPLPSNSPMSFPTDSPATTTTATTTTTTTSTTDAPRSNRGQGNGAPAGGKNKQDKPGLRRGEGNGRKRGHERSDDSNWL